MRLFSWHWPASDNAWYWPRFYEQKTGVYRHWLHIFYWWTAFLSMLFIAINMALYLAMSYFTLPFTYVNGVNVGMMSRTDAISKINQVIADKEISILVDGNSTNLTFAQLGISVDGSETFENVRKVDGLASLPLIQLFTNPTMNVIPSYNVDSSQLAQQLAPLIEEEEIAPISARVEIPFFPDEPITISKSVAGSRLNTEVALSQVASQLQDSPLAPQFLVIRPEVLTPPVQEYQLAAAKQQIEKILQTTISVYNEDAKKVAEISPYALRNMLSVDNAAQVIVKEDYLRNYLEQELSLYFFKEPVHKRVDSGVVTVAGKAGSALDIDAATTTLMQGIPVGKDSVTLTSTLVEPATVTDGQYPKTAMGLHALIRDFDAQKSGDYRIIVQQLTGKDRLRATHQGAASSIPASTYKAFIAYAAMWAEEQGELTLNDQTRHGSIKDCMYEMIHVSTDFCAFAIQDYMGWQRIDDILHASGFEHTKLNNEDRILDKYTTPQDEYKLLRGLYDGTLLNKEHTEHLLTLMKEQMWRSGIPGGSSPSIVADKVGFFAGWINDIGIVYGPKDDYIITALSDGGSFWEINDLSRRIYNFFNR